ncbi:MAG: hypothetical protein AAF385_08295 [Pseudomonadota bacterium]
MFSIAPLTGLPLAYCAALSIIGGLASLVWGFFGVLKNVSARASKAIFLVTLLVILSSIGFLTFALVTDNHLKTAYVYSLCVMLALAGLFFVRLVVSLTNPEPEASP